MDRIFHPHFGVGVECDGFAVGGGKHSGQAVEAQRVQQHDWPAAAADDGTAIVTARPQSGAAAWSAAVEVSRNFGRTRNYRTVPIDEVEN